MANKTYYEKLLDPRWQKKRLEIMERDGFKCNHCGNSEETLHIHHGYYERALEPWEYDSRTLWCLCSKCHELAQETLDELHALTGLFRVESHRLVYDALIDLI